jgi:hypothetical protein
MLSQIIKAIAVRNDCLRINPFTDDKRVKPKVAVKKPDAYKSINSSSLKL